MMTSPTKRQFLLGGASLFLAGCSGKWETNYSAGIDPAISRKWRLARTSVAVPSRLSVSEANTLAPNADIVWHGEPRGDRRAQVRAIMSEGISRGARPLRGSRPVVLNATLAEFHAVTPKAVSDAPTAVHNITFAMSVTDARSGQTITEPVTIRADLEAYTKSEAFVASVRGQTQRVRIVDHLSRVTAGWLGIGPDPRRSFRGIGR